jgi:excisionase family DNA binding protein
MDPARLYRPAEVAELLGCSEWWVKEQARKRRIPYSRIGGSYRFTAEHLAEIVRLHEVQRRDHHAAQRETPRRKDSDHGIRRKTRRLWRARYKIAPSKYGTVKDDSGATLRFNTKRGAEQAANDAEAKVRAGGWRDPTSGRITFGNYVNDWYERQDLAVSTTQTYKHHIEEHLLPAFECFALADITRADIDAWEKRERAAGYADASVRSWRKVLHLILADAVEDGRITVNPATKRRGRGRRAGRTTRRSPEKIITSALGVLLIAERAALLSGRDDEFVAIVTTGFTGIRWGELVGLRNPVRPSGRAAGGVATLRTRQRHLLPLPTEGRVASSN